MNDQAYIGLVSDHVLLWLEFQQRLLDYNGIGIFYAFDYRELPKRQPTNPYGDKLQMT